MTMLLSVLAVALTGSTSIAGLTKGVSTQQKEETLPPITLSEFQASREQLAEIDFSKSLAVAINDLQKESGSTEATIKTILERSMVMNETQQVSFDLTKLSDLQTSNLYQLIANNEALASSVLTKLVTEELLEYNIETGIFNFKEVTTIATYNSHVWVNYHWTWFLYWELHFDHEISAEIARYAGLGSIIIKIIGPVDGLWGVGLDLIAEACAAASKYFGERDKGNGVCFRWDGPVPRDVVSR